MTKDETSEAKEKAIKFSEGLKTYLADEYKDGKLSHNLKDGTFQPSPEITIVYADKQKKKSPALIWMVKYQSVILREATLIDKNCIAYLETQFNFDELKIKSPLYAGNKIRLQVDIPFQINIDDPIEKQKECIEAYCKASLFLADVAREITKYHSRKI